MGEAPPLAGSPWVTGPEERLIKIVLHGVHGPMQIEGKTYDQEMPGFGRIYRTRRLPPYYRSSASASPVRVTRSRRRQSAASAPPANRGRATGLSKSFKEQLSGLFAPQSELAANLHDFSIADVDFDILRTCHGIALFIL